MKHESRTQQQAFRMERAKRNLSTQDVADMFGVTRQGINLYEQDGRTILSRELRLFFPLCELYGLDPEEVGKLVDKQRVEEGKAKIGK